jgi:Fic family protein
MRFDRTKPYNLLPALPPKADIESKRILKRCITARSALAELKQAGELIPNQSVLINTIPLLEAQLSSEIENVVTTSDKLFRFASGHSERADPATKEALRYRQALHNGYKAIKQKPVCTSTAVEICRTILAQDIDIRKIPGTALQNPVTKKIIYTPPVGEDRIRKKLTNWERFINQNQDIDPLIRMAVTHYQFEAIHPFTDGNGRTGRILNLLFLIQEQLLTMPILYLSHYIIKTKNEYYASLRKVTEDEQWENGNRGYSIFSME